MPGSRGGHFARGKVVPAAGINAVGWRLLRSDESRGPQPASVSAGDVFFRIYFFFCVCSIHALAGGGIPEAVAEGEEENVLAEQEVDRHPGLHGPPRHFCSPSRHLYAASLVLVPCVP